MKTIGIIGGLGPMATAYYLELITKMTDAKKDQEHPRVLLQSIPDIPDRTAYILGRESNSPLEPMIEAGRQLAQMGADFITIPCVTAQFFYDELSEKIPVPVLPLCRNVAEDVAAKKIHRVGLLATTGTIQSKVLENEFNKLGVTVAVPLSGEQESVMRLVYSQVKGGGDVDWDVFDSISSSLFEQGAEKIILGCTEISLLKKKKQLPECYVDVLDVLARRAVLMSGAPLRQEYRDVIW